MIPCMICQPPHYGVCPPPRHQAQELATDLDSKPKPDLNAELRALADQAWAEGDRALSSALHELASQRRPKPDPQPKPQEQAQARDTRLRELLHDLSSAYNLLQPRRVAECAIEMDKLLNPQAYAQAPEEPA